MVLSSPRYNVNVTSGPPIIEWRWQGLQGSLQQGRAYQVRVYAINAKGRSDPVVLQELRLKGAAKYKPGQWPPSLYPTSHLNA